MGGGGNLLVWLGKMTCVQGYLDGGLQVYRKGVPPRLLVGVNEKWEDWG